MKSLWMGVFGYSLGAGLILLVADIADQGSFDVRVAQYLTVAALARIAQLLESSRKP